MKTSRFTWREIFGHHSFYIYLFSIYPILFLYRQNIKEVAFGEILAPMIVAIAFTTALWFCFGFIYKNKGKRALAILAILVLMFYYKLISEMLAGAISRLGKPWTGLPPAVLVPVFLFFFLFWLRKSKRVFLHSGKILNAIMLLLLAWNIGGMLIYHVGNVDVKNARSYLKKTELQKISPASSKPDIYCFILDEFASLETIRDVFHYDHSRFAERMQNAGFFIARQSRGLYIWTPEAIAALLNMEKVPEKADSSVLIKQNKVARFFREQGYRIFDFPYKGLTAMADSEKHFVYAPESASIFFNDFYKTLIDMSVFHAWAEKWQNDEDKYSRFFRERILYVFEQMPAVVKMAGPKFVLVHLFSPHAPFVFDRHGGMVAPEHGTDFSDRKYYLEQYLYISRRVAETMEMILKESAAPPVIVALSDHGYRGSFRKPLLHVVSTAEKKKIFMSLYLPGYDYGNLDDKLSPLNVFRIILNHYFGQKLPEVSPTGK
ncbi:MAG: hypothetical protein JXI33_06015 [Candidatus Aminicenantes bacterium]|nr:hypothetical protein [Candidatus Aminicenantes bacterium]